MKKILITIISISFLFTSCKQEGKTTKTKDDNQTIQSLSDSTEEVEPSEAICLLDKLSVRETPNAKGKWITSMSLGEKVIFTGAETTDSISKKQYYKVKLVDGKEGWTRSSFLVVDGKVGVMLAEVSIYKRPDLLTKTENKYSPMDIIAVISTQDEWINVKGKRADGKYIEEGWIKSSNISENPVDIATAKFAITALSKESMTDRIEALQEIVNNSDLATSSFIGVLNEKIKDYKEKNSVKLDPPSDI
ncbi:SH3 domain-containing protein [Tenacibaculum adriaticum]|uniref:SH3 domain-containing protein n=1 Tax=Tenacibaculum adriaticum TaxID=413713 RepID=A0A5S5DQ46_9FLAO|nr:SH3 domain-containing protein [Tenacibaculum adriaticum]TYP97508.1 SH3 domain-containing protein [Tenacibaculum adriaticum]